MLALGLIVRTLFISLHDRPLISDEREYDQLAYNLAARGIYVYDDTPTAYRPVGYPAIAGAVYSLAGHRPIAVKFAQALVDIATACLLYFLLASRSRRAALMAASFWALFPPAIFYANFLMTETSFTFLLLLAIFLLVRPRPSRTWGMILLGITFGALVLMKPGAALMLLIPVVLYRRLRLTRRDVALAIGCTILIVAPWIVRNWLTFGKPVLSSNGGVNLLIGNHPGATGAYNLSFDPWIMSGASNEFEAERRASQYAWEYITSNPGAFAVNAVKKLAHFFESESGLLVWTFHPQPETSLSRFGVKYRQIPLVLSVLTNLPYIFILLAGILGFVASDREAAWWVSLLLGGIWIGIHLVFFAGSRFHFPLMTVATTYAALALANPLSTLKELTTPRLAVWLIASGLLLTLWTFEGLMVFNV